MQEARARLLQKCTDEVIAEDATFKPQEPLLFVCRRIIQCGLLELRHLLVKPAGSEPTTLPMGSQPPTLAGEAGGIRTYDTANGIPTSDTCW